MVAWIGGHVLILEGRTSLTAPACYSIFSSLSQPTSQTFLASAFLQGIVVVFVVAEVDLTEVDVEAVEAPTRTAAPTEEASEAEEEEIEVRNQAVVTGILLTS